MKTTTKVLALCVLVLALAFGVHNISPLYPQAGEEVAQGGRVELVEVPRDSLVVEPAAPATAEAQSARSIIQRSEQEGAEDEVASPPRATGQILVRVRDASTGEGTAGIGLELHLWKRASSWFDRREGVTGEDGLLRFNHVPAGESTVYIHRLSAENSYGAESIEVVAGETSEVEFEVVAGSTVRGRVIDWAGRPMPGAQIWLGEGGGPPRFGEVVTRSAADGSFEIRHAGSYQAVAAWTPGYAPSPAVIPLFGYEDEDGEYFIELVLPGLGGSLEGLVVDASGHPQADALVLVGTASQGQRTSDESYPTYGPPMRRLRTDSAGQFRVEGLAPTSLRVKARSRGTSIAETQVEIVPGEVAQVRLELGEPGRIVGRVTRADGQPVEGARIELDYDGDEMQRASTSTDIDGVYELEDVPTGTIVVIAELAEERLEVRTELRVRAGDASLWDPVFPSTCALRGVLVGADGQSLTGWGVHRQTTGSKQGDGGMTQALASTGPDGRFEFESCPSAAQDLTVRPPGQIFAKAVAHLDGFEPWNGEITLTVPMESIPRGSLHGRLVNEAGDPIQGAQISLFNKSPIVMHAIIASAADGSFSFQNMPQVGYGLTIEAKGYAPRKVVSSAALGAGEERELGELLLTPVD